VKWWHWFALGVASLTAVGVYLHADSNSLRDRLQTANERAEAYQLQVMRLEDANGTLQHAYRELALQTDESAEVRERLEDENAALADSIESVLLSYQQVTTELDAALDESETEVADTPDGVDVSLNERVSFHGGGHLVVTGRLHIGLDPTRIIEREVHAAGEFPLTIVLSRAANDDLEVTAFTGDPRLGISQLDVVQNVQDPLTEDQGGLFELLDRALFSPGPWIDRGIGAAVMCLIVCR
jgi:hypothetical protein